jgi:hypothetical protein
VPAPLPIHRIARVLWLSMVVMGLMAVVVGLVLSFIQVGTEDARDLTRLSTYTQGLQFMG